MREEQYVTVRCSTRSINIRKFCTLHTPFYLIFATHLNDSRFCNTHMFIDGVFLHSLTNSLSNYQQQERQHRTHTHFEMNLVEVVRANEEKLGVFLC